MREAMVLRGSMNLRSYDRLFPNQDVLPEGGFGNLIAAPLQGRRRKDGLTTFLDLGTLEPYTDQWAFLSTLDRLSPGDAEHVARQAKQAVTGADVAAMSQSAATQVHPPLPPVVHAETGAGLTIDAGQLTPAALATFKHAAAMVNPKFYELQRLRKSTWDTPRFIQGYDLTLDDHRSSRGACGTPSPRSSSAPGPGWPSRTHETPGPRSTPRSPPNSPASRPPRSARFSPTTRGSWSLHQAPVRPS
ncbi:hypothetical protein O7628_15935 [Micromonospora sp. WMMD956]|uniref:TOTE conflict system archaeo-eukaryotic primase domain-containing protein n=1 Tax=Micromonospora sp. WMMD956 TaxID=3016108 RepID=UPI002415AFE2|nr:hypothetical protein [Micromonospora sp. WMMD956]MDG4816986.1 hypothetical protein [Micromonospora sp. WMMD956]